VGDNFTSLLDGMSVDQDSLSGMGGSRGSHSFDDGGFLAQNCEDYLDSYMEDELKYKLDMGGIEKNQAEIKWKMRAILYDWISEVCTDYMFNRDTYHSAVKIVDLFLMKFASVKKSEFQ
jgi:hypothetical protein